jgi:hypothetical protein
VEVRSVVGSVWAVRVCRIGVWEIVGLTCEQLFVGLAFDCIGIETSLLRSSDVSLFFFPAVYVVWAIISRG